MGFVKSSPCQAYLYLSYNPIPHHIPPLQLASNPCATSSGYRRQLGIQSRPRTSFANLSIYPYPYPLLSLSIYYFPFANRHLTIITAAVKCIDPSHTRHLFSPPPHPHPHKIQASQVTVSSLFIGTFGSTLSHSVGSQDVHPRPLRSLAFRFRLGRQQSIFWTLHPLSSPSFVLFALYFGF